MIGERHVAPGRDHELIVAIDGFAKFKQRQGEFSVGRQAHVDYAGPRLDGIAKTGEQGVSGFVQDQERSFLRSHKLRLIDASVALSRVTITCSPRILTPKPA